MSIGVPIKVLHEAEGHIVTCETNTGEVYRGKLIEAEDNMNCQMSNITVTYRDGRVAQLEQWLQEEEDVEWGVETFSRSEDSALH
ncbi:rCG60635, isoform CRA_a [Rattus norvegicus]|uniref:Small nuclear ribonucleoprotein Sm D3 n=1 Tax=Rattus norvegicus TaxID=10116 RepID=A6JKJ8_RAT|nr:rCG60635, isoform CRA_a [Rattus norvegicus]